MSTVVSRIETPTIGYANYTKPAAEKPLQNGTVVLTERERKLKEIAVLMQYMEDLKAGRPVDNISPSNDPYFLVPENIADMIQDLHDMLDPNVKPIRFTTLKDLIGEWENI